MQPKLEDLGALFYIVPFEATYNSIEDVPNYITKAIPFFLLLAVLEFFYGKFKKYNLYTFKDSIMSFSLGTVEEVLGLFIKSFTIVPYTIVFNAVAPFRKQLFAAVFGEAAANSPFSPMVHFWFGFLMYDMAYYWFHRIAHEFHLLWVAHSVHHSGERYNLATALRQSALQTINSSTFYLYLAILGLPPPHFVRHQRLNTLYQFWIHTEAIGRLPWWFELFFNSASHHRIHHRPPGNCNYAGVLIIWDRIFGTFQSEMQVIATGYDIPDTTTDSSITLPSGKAASTTSQLVGYPRGIIYGLANPLNTYDPVYTNVQHLVRLLTGNSTFSDLPFTKLLKNSMMVFRKRVHHPLQIVPVWDWARFMPDIVHDWQYEYKILQFAQGKCNVFQWIRYQWLKLFTLPPVAEDVTVSQADKTNLFTTRDYEFIAGRTIREGPTLSTMQTIFVMVHFVIAMGISLALLESHPPLYFWRASVDDITYMVGSGIGGIMLLQSIKFHYFWALDHQAKNGSEQKKTK